MNNFRRSVEEIVQVVKIADTTLKKRLDEFKKTPSGALTLADFRTVWLDEEMDPPAFTKGKEKEEKEREEALHGPKDKLKKQKRKGKRKRRGSESEGERVEFAPPLEEIPPQIPILDPALFNQGILAGTSEPAPLFYPDENEEVYANIDPALRPASNTISHELDSPTAAAIDETVDQALADEVASFLQNTQGSLLRDALDEAEQRRQAQFAEVDELLGLDEDELDRFLLTEEEVKIKERVWVEINRDYLEALAAKGEPTDVNQPKSRKRRKTNTKPRDDSIPSGNTAAESVRNLIKKNPKYSKRINYDALKDLFVDGPQAPSLDDKENLYTMDDTKDGEGMTVLEEDGGDIGTQRSAPRLLREEQGDEGDDDESEKGDDHITDVGWEEAYEQEV
jgi:transcription factor IIIB subunit 2